VGNSSNYIFKLKMELKPTRKLNLCINLDFQVNSQTKQSVALTTCELHGNYIVVYALRRVCLI